MTRALTVDNLRCDVVRSPRRRTIELTVERDGSLVVRAPEGATAKRLEAFVRLKRGWVYRKLAQKEALRWAPAVKEYITGEDFRYLGRSYRLLLVDMQDMPLQLKAGRFCLQRLEVRQGRAHFVRWYAKHARAWLLRRVSTLAPRVGVKPAGVEVRDLGYRWGSCGEGGRLHFHWKAILLPAPLVEYVVVHELVHLLEPHHTAEFWRMVERVVPDFAARKRWLAENAQEAVTI